MLPDSAKTTDQDIDASANDTDEFDTAFDEASSDSSAPADDAAADKEPDDQADDDAGDEREPADDEPAGKETDAAASAPAEDQVDEIWNDVPPAAREAYENLKRDAEHRERSLRGRVSVLDRTLNEYRKGEAKPQDGKEEKEQPQETAADDLLESDEFKQFSEEYGEVAGPITKVLKGLQDKVNELSGSVGEVNQDREVAILQTNETQLTERHPDWQNLAADDRFMGWLETQPTAIKQAAQRNWNGIVDPDDASIVFDRFRTDFKIGKPSDKVAEAEPKETDAKRKRQLDSGKDTRIKAAPAASDEPDNFDAVFENAAKKADKRRRQHHGF